MIDSYLKVARERGYTVYNWAWGDSSLRQLNGVLPALVDHATLTLKLHPVDCTIVPPGGGLRTIEQAQANAATGTGILNSRHLRQSDGYGHAYDMAPLKRGVIDWSDLDAFKALAETKVKAAVIMQLPLRFGFNWDMDDIWGEKGEYDWSHVEDPLPWYADKAKEELARYTAKYRAVVVPLTLEERVARLERLAGIA